MLKIFEIIHEDGNREWVTGSTNIEAISAYVMMTDCNLFDIESSEIIEIKKEKWVEYKVREENGIEKSFEQWMNIYGNGRPDIIAGTMY